MSPLVGLLKVWPDGGKEVDQMFLRRAEDRQSTRANNLRRSRNLTALVSSAGITSDVLVQPCSHS